METWHSETQCECTWAPGPYRQNSRRQRRADNLDNGARRLFDTSADRLPVENNMNIDQWRPVNISTDSEPSFSLVNGDNSDDEYGVSLYFIFGLFFY